MPSQCICLKSVSKHKGNNIRKKRWPNRMNSEPTRIEHDRQWWTFSETRHGSPISFPIQRAVFTKFELPLKMDCPYDTNPWTEFYIWPNNHLRRHSLAKFPYIVPKTLVERGRPVPTDTPAIAHRILTKNRSVCSRSCFWPQANCCSLYDTIQTKHGSKDGRLYLSL